MRRFLLPASTMMGALVVLLAGALSDPAWLSDLSMLLERSLSAIDDQPSPTVSSQATPFQPQVLPPLAAETPATPALAEEQSARDALQRQIDALQQQATALQRQIAQRMQELDQRNRQLDQRTQELDQRSRDIAAAQAEAEKTRQALDALRQQRVAEEAALAKQKAEEAALSRQRAKEQQLAAAQPRPAPPQAPPQPPPQPQAATPTGSSAAQQLQTARQWLAAGRPDEARRLLAIVQTQLVLQPVTPDQPTAQTASASAADVGNAIHWLDLGANGPAMQAINHAIGSANAPSRGPLGAAAPSNPGGPVRAWSGYPGTQSSGYPPPYGGDSFGTGDER